MAQKRRRKSTRASADSAGAGGPEFEAPAQTELQRSYRRLARDQARAARAANPAEPTPEQLQRNQYSQARTHDPVTGFPIHLRRCLSMPIDRLLSRGMVTERQHDAAARYRVDYDKSGFERSVVSNYDGATGAGSGSPNYTGMMAANNAQMDARARLHDARQQLPVRLRPAFEGLVCHDDELREVGESAGRTGTMAARMAAEYIRICADILADYYRI